MTLMQLARIAEGRGANLMLTFMEGRMERMAKMEQPDDLQLLAMAKQNISDARKCGNTLCFVPVWLMEQLVEKAERPHD